MSEKSIKYQLKNPVQHGSEIVTEINVRKPTVKDLRQMPVGGNLKLGDWAEVIISCGDQPKSVVDKIEIDDMFELTGLMGNFLPVGRETGAN